MNAEILAVGTELLLGNIVNTDARDISVMLSELGINVYWHTVVGDNPQRLTEAVAVAKQRAGLIITTGGLGPTCDDLTKQVLASAFGLELEYNEEAARRIKAFFERSDMKMTENNMLQAYLPRGCTPFQNDWGTAPGCAFRSGDTLVLMLPGPPRECNAMFRNRAMPYLRSLSDEQLYTHNIRIFGQGESAVEDKLKELMNSLVNPTLAPYAKEGEVMLRVTAKAKNRAQAEEMMAPVLEKVRGVLGDFVYGVDVESLEETVFRLLDERHMTMAAAESCTGGYVAKRMTDIPGASRVFKGGVVTYTNEAKSVLLGIDPGLISAHTAVSREVAAEMAERVREKLDADIGVSVTGLAGPDGDGVHQVGDVFTALSVNGKTYIRENHLSGRVDRSRIRLISAHHAFDMIRRYIMGLDVEIS